MSPPATVIRQLLIDAGLGEESGDWQTFVSFLPEVPDSAICVYDTAGRFDGRIMNGGEQIEHEGIMIYVRGIGYPTVWNKANDIAKTLDAVNNALVTVGSEFWGIQNISRTSPVMPLGVDVIGGKRRHEFTINMLLTMRLLNGEEVPFTPWWDNADLNEHGPFYVEN